MMHARLPMLVGLLGALVACQDSTAPLQDPDSPSLRAAMYASDRWELLMSFGEYDAEYYYPCINDGAGESVTWDSYYYWWTKDVVTPSGNVIQTQWLEWSDDTQMVGKESGDVWTLEKLVQPMVVRITKQTDGLRVGENVMNESWVNQDGDRMISRSSGTLVFDENWGILDITRYNVVCRFLPAH